MSIPYSPETMNMLCYMEGGKIQVTNWIKDLSQMALK